MIVIYCFYYYYYYYYYCYYYNRHQNIPLPTASTQIDQVGAGAVRWRDEEHQVT